MYWRVDSFQDVQGALMTQLCLDMPSLIIIHESKCTPIFCSLRMIKPEHLLVHFACLQAEFLCLFKPGTSSPIVPGNKEQATRRFFDESFATNKPPPTDELHTCQNVWHILIIVL